MLDLFRTLPNIVGDLEGANVLREAIVFAAWRRIAGESLSEHAVPIRLENTRLTIAVSNMSWRRNLKDLAGQMVFKLNAALGSAEVKFIEFEIDEAAVLSSRSDVSTVNEEELRREAERSISPELARAAESIEDEELRKQFLGAAGMCLVRSGQ